MNLFYIRFNNIYVRFINHKKKYLYKIQNNNYIKRQTYSFMLVWFKYVLDLNLKKRLIDVAVKTVYRFIELEENFKLIFFK
jgi:hypothetical protein